MENPLKDTNAHIESIAVNDVPNCKQGSDMKVNDCSTDLNLSNNHVGGDIQLSCEKKSLNNDLVNNKGDADTTTDVEEPLTNNDDIANDMGSKSPPSASSGVVNTACNTLQADNDDELLADDPSDVPVTTENEDCLLGDDDSPDKATASCDEELDDSRVEASSRESQPPQTSEAVNPIALDDSPKENATNAEESLDRTESGEKEAVSETAESTAPSDEAMEVDENSSTSIVSQKPGVSPEPMDTLDGEVEKNSCPNDKESDIDSPPTEFSATVNENSGDSASKFGIKSVDSESGVNEDSSCEKSSEKDDSSKDVDPPPSTEVFQVDDDNEDDLDIMMDSSEKDPIAQENENSEPQVEGKEDDELETSNDEPKTSTEGVDEGSKDGDAVCEEDSSTSSAVGGVETSKSSARAEAGSEKSSETSENSNSAEKADDDENCIIPDASEGDPVKEVQVVHKQIRKFDITPVRLEKLMDPSKLAAAVKLESDKNSPSRPQRQAAKKAETQIKEIVAQTDGDAEEPEQNAVCSRCSRLRLCKYIRSSGIYSCAECNQNLMEKKLPAPVRILSAVKGQPLVPPAVQRTSNKISDQCFRKCAFCGGHNIVDEKSLSWEALDFCNEECINRYQVQNGSYCAYCNLAVQHVSMGKYAVRFGLEARQFCSGACLEEFKKGLKSCSYCQLDITNSTESVCASVGEKQTTMKEFCSRNCVEKYELMSSGASQPQLFDACTVCANKKTVEIQVSLNSHHYLLCSDACFRAFKFGNNILETNQCVICKNFYPQNQPDSFLVHHDDSTHHFCSKICMNVFILFKRKIVPCSWCKVKKYNFDMIKKMIPNGACVMMCSLNCLTLYQVSMNASSTRKIKCDLCSNVAHAQYHLTMSDATIRNFCSYNCVMVFQTQYNKTPLTLQEQNKSNLLSVPVVNTVSQKSTGTIANGLLSSASANIKIGSPLTVAANSTANLQTVISTSSGVQIQKPAKHIQQILVKPPEPKAVANKFTQCRPAMSTKSVSCRPTLNSKACQTEESSNHPPVLPIPVPIYVPFPLPMYSKPFPVPVPFALPIPVPVFIPTTQKTFKGIMSQMKEILEKTPSNPFEADLLVLAKMVAGDDKNVEDVTKNDSGDDADTHFADAVADSSDSETFAEAENSVPNNFNDEMIQTVMQMANEQLNKTPTVDLEAELTSNTITPQTQVEESNNAAEVPEPPVEKPRTRKRTLRSNTEATTRKRTRSQLSAAAEVKNNPPPPPPPPKEVPVTNDVSLTPQQESERPDASMCLKYTIGVRAWKQWLISKNEQIEQAATTAHKKAKLFNTNILKLTTDELNYLLCMFVKEVRKPNGMEYAPDTIYYLCLSIQQYLFENGRIDNIFTDSFYEPFTNALDEVARKFSDINDATQYIVTRVEEEHLWESKQLGAHSPHVLLATLMFFNTKYFNLSSLEEHMQLSFSHIMKHWKRNPNAPAGKPGSPVSNRNVVLRFYPPQAALDAPNSRKKKVYEQHENEVNPLRCPVKLYEFYLSKCPESVKQRNDVFYLQPERSCVPDSPVWYSTMPLQKDLLMKMLHRIRMVKEVNISLLAS